RVRHSQKIALGDDTRLGQRVVERAALRALARCHDDLRKHSAIGLRAAASEPVAERLDDSLEHHTRALGGDLGLRRECKLREARNTAAKRRAAPRMMAPESRDRLLERRFAERAGRRAGAALRTLKHVSPPYAAIGRAASTLHSRFRRCRYRGIRARADTRSRSTVRTARRAAAARNGYAAAST